MLLSHFLFMSFGEICAHLYLADISQWNSSICVYFALVDTARQFSNMGSIYTLINTEELYKKDLTTQIIMMVWSLTLT